MLIDTHVHLNADQYEGEVDAVIERAKENGVEKFVVIGFDRKTIERTMELIESYDEVYGVIGWHPVDAIDCTDEDLEWIESLSSHEKIVAIGEIGLDYHWDKSPKDIQKEVFIKQIELAKRVNLPIVIHNRDADEDTIDILESHDAKSVGGIMHSFHNGTDEQIDRVLNMGFYVSLAGVITFKNVKRPKEVAQYVPLDRLLVETDAPYLTPHPFRGKRNEPKLVRLVAEEIAQLRGISVEEVEKATTENAKRIYNI
ncbi:MULTISPECIES: TatD family hydrolase [Nosocomiicoccus]|uniref:TatD family hydrolase n=1 Tax=Nosocomiicoccus massiliensis TaxID=1232430 RepID=A0AAF0YJU5_9STAP|nr:MULTISPECIES: TatD family hydrolase [Nosocomiicoccus]OFL49515.1 hydrolase TatD [Nosocomiicoccus sp. HMSC067E10]OFS61811.1 hydrolase TatD [Nosocomiicoccus sp. HMSC09A07]WOS95607.1 TatD family hydrolase [Nosocomiicoccus massiliensis]